MSGNLFDGQGLAPAGGSGEWLTAHCDGGSRGNPGPAGYGAVIEDGQGRVVARLSEYLGKQTNNYAEYSGLLAVLAWAAKHGAKRLRILSDSELMVKQMRGQYKVASPGLKPLWEQARRLAGQFEGFELKHTLRGGNKEADKLANEAMDRGMGKAPAGAGTSVSTGPPRPGGSIPGGSGPGGSTRSPIVPWRIPAGATGAGRLCKGRGGPPAGGRTAGRYLRQGDSRVVGGSRVGTTSGEEIRSGVASTMPLLISRAVSTSTNSETAVADRITFLRSGWSS
jgi:probable phosphoglycerate mutase